MAESLAESGVRGFWNFSNAELCLENFPDVIIENVHLGDSLMALCYSLALGSEPIAAEAAEVRENSEK